MDASGDFVHSIAHPVWHKHDAATAQPTRLRHKHDAGLRHRHDATGYGTSTTQQHHAKLRHKHDARLRHEHDAGYGTAQAGYGTSNAGLRRPGRRQQARAPCPLRARAVRIAIRFGRVRLPEAMTVMATAMVRPPPGQRPQRRRPTRLPTLAARRPGAASGLPPSSNPYTPASGSVYSQPAASTSRTGARRAPYPSSGAAPPASSDSGEPAYRPGSTRTSGDFSPRNISSLSPSSLGSNSSGSGVVPAGYTQTSDARN